MVVIFTCFVSLHIAAFYSPCILLICFIVLLTVSLQFSLQNEVILEVDPSVYLYARKGDNASLHIHESNDCLDTCKFEIAINIAATEACVLRHSRQLVSLYILYSLLKPSFKPSLFYVFYYVHADIRIGLYCSHLKGSDRRDGTIFGSRLMYKYYTIFDRAKEQIGFALSGNCTGELLYDRYSSCSYASSKETPLCVWF